MSAALDIALREHCPGLRLGEEHIARKRGDHRSLLRIANVDVPGWGRVQVTEHPSGRVQLHSATPYNGPRVVEIADLNRGVPPAAIALFIGGLAHRQPFERW